MTWEFGEYELDEELLELRLRGTQIHLSPLPLRVLIHLAQNSSRAVPSDELRKVLWPEVIVAETSLRQAVRSLRHALGTEGAKRITSVRGYGYRLAGPVRRSQRLTVSVASVEVARTVSAAPSAGVELNRPFVGRHSELRWLLGAAEHAGHGKAQVMLVTGRPGLGKTRLAEELSALVQPGMRVVWGRCWEGGGSPPFWPWDDVRRGMLGDDGQDGPEQDEPMLDGSRRGDAGPFHLSSQDPHTRFRLFEAFTELVRRQSETIPLVIVLDDLHAAEEPALLLLSFLARELLASKTLILGTYRDEEMRRRTRCAEIIDRLASSATTIALHGLDTDSIRAFVEDATRRTAHPEVVSRLLEITGGNPLFLHELVRFYGDAIADGVPDLIDVARSPTPIRDAIRRQLRPLSPRAREMMSASAILGTEADLSVLGEMLSWSADELAIVSDEVTTAGLMNPVGPVRLRFSHMLLREVLCEELDAVQRRSLHRRAAEGLARSGHATQPRSAAAIAHHLLGCLPDSQAAKRAVDALAQAAAEASSVMAHEEARRYHRTALGLLEQMGPPDKRWFELTVRLVDAERLCGSFADARTLALGAVAWARSQGTPEEFAEAVRACARAHPETGAVDHTLMALFEEALARLPERPSWLRVTLSARLAVLLSFSHDDDHRCVALSEQALSDARQLDDPRAVGHALSARIFCLIGLPTPEARRLLTDALDEALLVSRICDDPDITLELLAWGYVGMLNRGLVERAREEHLRFEQLCRVARRPLHEWHLRSTRAARAIWEGDFAQGEALAADALDYGTRMQAPYALSCYGGQMFQIRRDQGRLGELLPLLKARAAEFPTMAVWRAGLALGYAEIGDAENARVELDRVADRDFSDLTHDLNWFPVVTMLASVSAELEDLQLSALLYRWIEPMEAGLVTAGAVTAALGVRDEAMGLLSLVIGDASRAVEHFRAALRFTQRLGALPWVARSQLGLVRALLRLPRDGQAEAEAMATARQAHELARRLGMTRVLADLGAILSQGRATHQTITQRSRSESAGSR